MTPQDVLNFWFVESGFKKWYAKDPIFDQAIRERFGALHEQALRDELNNWRATPEGRLAEIILLDQFSRNIYRDSAKAFAGDALALQLAQEAVASGADQSVGLERRAFFYMPYMHSESKEAQLAGMPLFESTPNAKYAREHKEIIDRFGRYPHRNAILGRDSTPEEIEFLKTHKGF